MLDKIKKKIRFHLGACQHRDWEDSSLILLAQVIMGSEEWRKIPEFKDSFWLQKKEFRVYSQFGDDGIIQWLISYLNLNGGRFIELGVGDFYESNTHFLLINNRFSGFVVDGSKTNIDTIKKSSIYWRYGLNAVRYFVNKDNVQKLLETSGFKKIELLHIDLDGNDYWILNALDLSELDPDILILEYNATFGRERAITIPYDSNFYRMKAHYSGKYFGASLLALNNLAARRGYYFIGCNSAGNNAYFLANRFLPLAPKTDIYEGFQEAGYRESRDKKGRLTFLDADQEMSLLRGLPVIDTMTGKSAKL